MIMCNGVFFNGFWKNRFPVLATVEETHYDEKLKINRYVRRMHLKAKVPYLDIPYLNSTVLELPIGDEGKWVMIFVFPHRDVPLSHVYTQLRSYSLDTLVEIIDRDEVQEVDIKLPRFRLERQVVLTKPLGQMGLREAFKLDLQGGFLGIATEDIYIGDFEHMASIFVSETGVRALATTPGFDGYASKIHNGGLKAEKPFVFFLMEKPSRTPVFCGSYTFERYF
ncbi:leukocyte elastase inhibitor-like [Bicyclus anynana]|uniref:Leukocyte elastase inhibitor-like n=1 Tax=Bicyclus anynana TaxID=110368 RepID=A0A6J1NKK4_BICAN|nr:leukocyte elastase inhibitor-like [Bicyclus anynana]